MFFKFLLFRQIGFPIARDAIDFISNHTSTVALGAVGGVAGKMGAHVGLAVGGNMPTTVARGFLNIATVIGSAPASVFLASLEHYLRFIAPPVSNASIQPTTARVSAIILAVSFAISMGYIAASSYHRTLNDIARRKQLMVSHPVVPAYTQRPSTLPDTVEIPEEYLCPIGHDIMLDPVTMSDGHTYERGAIQAWYDMGKLFSPINLEAKLENPAHVRTNINLRIVINKFISERRSQDKEYENSKNVR
jgi:hypothetical protein